MNKKFIASQVLLLSAIVIYGFGCASKNTVPLATPTEKECLYLLPAELQVEHLSLGKLLQAYDALSDEQRIAALKHFLRQINLSNKERSEGSYMLARLCQQSATTSTAAASSTLEFFDQAANYAPLKAKSLWHKSEVATVMGKEKIVRQSLTDFLAQTKDPAAITAAQYAMAQSFLRANEIDQAINLFNKIRVDFPNTDYALGASYYLGTLNYNRLEQCLQDNIPANSRSVSKRDLVSALLEKIRAYYFEYLKASPSGHFSADILCKLGNLIKGVNHPKSNSSNFLLPPWSLQESEWVLMARAYMSCGEYKLALSCWQKASADKHLLAIADCLAKLEQIKAAQETLFKGLMRYPYDKQSLPIANEISLYLNKTEVLSFWRRLQGSKFCCPDELIWNLAIRVPLAQALGYYQNILMHYPWSRHAPAAQWHLLWAKFKSTHRRSLPTLASNFYAAAKKYNKSPLAARFLFWAGKSSEITGDSRQAAFYYREAIRLYPFDYYGQRAEARHLSMAGSADDYFSSKEPFIVSDQFSPWPVPEAAIAALRQTGQEIAFELIYLKQYAEALAEDVKLEPTLAIWLKGKTGYSWLAIAEAASYLKKNALAGGENALLWYYSYPLLFDKQIVAACKSTGIDDPFLVHALIREESYYNPHAVSQAKALGLCQLMPATANSLAKRIGINISQTNELFKADLNIKLGVAYLFSALQTFQGNRLLAVASYNAGINAVKNQLPNKGNVLLEDPDLFVEDFPFRETRDYMRKVFASYWHYRQIYKLR